jgi:hypothetical protein
MDHFISDLPREVVAGFWLGLGAAIGMVLWAFLSSVVSIAYAVSAACLVRLSRAMFKNGKGERVFPNTPGAAKESTVNRKENRR